VQVTNMQFATLDTGHEEPVAEPPLGIDGAIWFKLGEILILSVTALLVGFFIVKPMIRRLTAPILPEGVAQLAGAGAHVVQPGDAGMQAPAPAQIANTPQNTPLSAPRRDAMIDINQIEGQVRESAIRKVGEVVTSHPDEAMAILRTWLHQPG
jgi:flagellar M-ring protein FliF